MTGAVASRSRLACEIAAWRTLKASWPATARAVVEWLELGDRPALGVVTAAVAQDWQALLLLDELRSVR